MGQVIETVGWESDFVCEGVSSLTEFSSLVNEIESLEPVSCGTHFTNARGHGSAAQTFQKISGVPFARWACGRFTPTLPTPGWIFV